MKIPPKKSLGQHFLRSKKAIKDIIHASNIKKGDVVLEVGPGEGVLTEALLVAGGHVIAVEKDARAITLLEEKFKKEEGRLRIIEGDILEMDLEELGLEAGKYQVIANIPYYITGILIRKLLESPVRPSAMTLLVQKEVADRIVARDEKESLLSLGVKAYGEPFIVSRVKAGSFVPAPKVDSAIIRIEDIGPHKAGEYEDQFWTITKAAFNGKRKTLSHTIGHVFENPEKVFEECGIDPKERPENVSLNKWILLARHVT
ncbi:MAG: ribosomal RNA small subunit methyltransferase A [Candidatus Zambryskibacteria bacterium CG10_big_fil_rev_8_21_14_0_10_42_12]|uniref:Ribosomal RNA small subunit methyltransferase A n=1 Tax=Candidatus Zambryskibacteria bacterium CG10_big_fil_rev_8_21_14_0_10_42_12 TaxID=1975115 RepID=A0A2H0QSP4_9BACT|nr:MAG: ribosomal RNA small subunit methyltransferase A [Candidatus Zambryskibacteria bacterium CG10_big_fil_rev_8_21_14_0_10_42_12]